MAPTDEQGSFWRRSTFAFVLLPLMALLLNWPYLMGGFAGDDIIFLNVLEQDPLPFSRWHGVWSLNDYPFMDHLWWKDWSDPGDSGVFWRPIPSLIFEGSLLLFGKAPFPLHLLAVLLHGGVSVGLYLLVRNMTGRHGLALLAGLFFVTCEDHSMGVGWIAASTDVICAQFVLLALLAHVHWLKSRTAGAMTVSLLALAAAMGCKESAAAAPVAIVLLSVLMPAGKDQTFTLAGFRERAGCVIKDPLSWLPHLVVLAAYLTVYRAMNMGAFSNLMYINPLADPGGYLSHLVLHLPVMWLGTLSPMPPFVTMLISSLLLPMAIFGAVIFAAWLVALWPFRKRSLTLWSLLTYLVFLLPQLGTDASERGLYFPMIPAAVLLASLALTIAPLARRAIPNPPARPRWTRVMGWFAVAGILIPGVLLSAAMPWIFLPGMEKCERELGAVLPCIERYRPEHVLILNTSGFLLTLYAYDTLNHLSEQPQDSWILSSANGVFTLVRIGEASFVIRTDRAGWLDNIFARILRTGRKLKVGRRYETAVFTATLIELTRSGRDVLAVRFDLYRPLDDPGWLFLKWNGEAFEPLDLAALPKGERVKLADTSDLWKAMY